MRVRIPSGALSGEGFVSILITGGSGFFGRHLIRHLLDTEREHIVAVDTDVAPQLEGSDGRTTWIRCDVLDAHLLAETLRRHAVRAIVHLACLLESRMENVRGQIEVNVMGTTNVFDAARRGRVPRVVYMSSAYVYPHRRELGGHRYSEEDLPAPDGVYGACKVFNEHVAAQYAKMHGFSATGLRFTAVFGPGRSARAGIAPDDHNVLPELALRGQRVVMPPDEQLSDWMYIADAAEVIRLALSSEDPGHRVYNVASECRPVGEVTEIVRGLVPQADVAVADAPVVMPSLLCTDRVRRELGFTPRYTTEEGLAAYFRALQGSDP